MPIETTGKTEVSTNALFNTLLRENFILKAQLGALRDLLLDKGIIDEEESENKLKSLLANIDEKEYKEYIIETAKFLDNNLDKDFKN